MANGSVMLRIGFSYEGTVMTRRQNDFVEQLSRLIGKPFWMARRSLNLHCFHFGECHEKTDRKGNVICIGTHFLHVQCAWRILHGEQILVASRDRLTPRGNPSEIPDDFTSNEPGSTLCDEKLKMLLKRNDTEPLAVISLEMGICGAFRLKLTKDYALEVFPDDSTDEQWRYFDMLTEDAEGHFVFTMAEEDDNNILSNT